MTDEEFVAIVKGNSQRVFLIALSFAKNHSDAEDIMQEVFVKLWKCRDKFQTREHIYKWLTVVTANESKNLLKFYARRSTCSIETLSERFTFDDTDDKDLFNAVMALPPKLSLVVHLFYYEDMSINDIAETLNVSNNVIKTRLSRGRSKLKEMLGGTWTDEQ